MSSNLQQTDGALSALLSAHDGSEPGWDLLSQALSRQKAKDFAGAEDLYRRFLKTHPNHLAALNNAGLVAKALGRHDVALMRLNRAVRRYPNAAEAHFNLGNTLQEMNRLADSIAPYRRAIELRAGYAKAHLNLGNVFDGLRRYEEAAACYRQALSCGESTLTVAETGEAYCNLANCLKAQGQMVDALVHFICATRVDPERADFHFGAGIAHYELRHHEDAIASLRRVLDLDANHEGARSTLMFQYQFICDWRETAVLASPVRAGTDKALAAGLRCSEGAFDSLTRDADPGRNQAVAMSSARGVLVGSKLYRRRRAAPGTEKIRIGYLSADFRDHPVAQVMGGVFSRHDRNRFTVTAYSYGPDDDSVWRRRIAQDCDRFVDMNRVSDDGVARQISDDGIDILVDLTLWTQGGRPRICALRPAAVQVQYLGFPGTSGSDFHDYAIVDRVVVPPEERGFWSERLIYMPQSYFVADRDQPVAVTSLTRAQCGLPEGGIVFCSFNQSFKIDAVIFAAWMRILAQVPGGVLWLPQGGSSEANLRREAAQAGIAPERLIFAGRTTDKAAHLERLALADIALDTLIYNGHTTTSDALWAGLPVIAMMGRHFASRVSASLLMATGLDELIARDVPDYVALAVKLAEAPAERARLRALLTVARSKAPLFDTGRTVTDLERAYEQIWTRFNAGQSPADIQL